MGGILSRELQAQGHQVIVSGRKDSEAKNYLCWDLCEPKAPRLPEFDWVIHAAGMAHRHPKTAQDRQAFFDLNEKGTQNLLKALQDQGRTPKAILYVSTVAVYGLDRGFLISESQPPNPRDPYGISKYKGETHVLHWAAEQGIVVGIMRLPLVVGSGAPGNIENMTRMMAKGRYFGIGTGKNQKSMVWGADLAAVIPALAERGGIYNFTDGKHPCFRDFEARVAAQLNRKPPSRLPITASRLLGLCGSILAALHLPAPLTVATVQKMTTTLTFCDRKAAVNLGWNPTPVLDHMKQGEWQP